MKRRAACVFGFTFVCAVLTAACSFSDRAEHCDNDDVCFPGRCYEGFCIPARDGNNMSSQMGSDGGPNSGGSGARTGGGSGGKGGAGGEGASSSMNMLEGGSGGAGNSGGSGGAGNGMLPSGGEGEPCPKEGEERACIVNTKDTTLAETCNRGMQVCADGEWGRCNGQAMPVPETCNNLDDDCNGEVDDLTEVCYPDGQAGCTKDADGKWTCSGACGTGTRTCSNGQLTECQGASMPETEVCTPEGEVARDEDCDKDTDEGCDCQSGMTRMCYNGRPATTMGVGKCVAGSQTCGADGKYGPCTGEVLPQAETCANARADDDCNGTTDDIPMLNGRCTVANTSGPCMTGTLRCTGSMLTCQSAVMPTTEVCNNRDDNCNGTTDEGFNLKRDVANCGVCGNRCDAGDACCAGACANTQTSANNCGACGMKCPTGQRCAAGKCMAPTMPMAGMPPAGGTGGTAGSTGGAGASGGTGGAGTGAACSPACAAGETCCGGACVNLMTDVMQCGACGNVCMGAKPGCCGGVCNDLANNDKNCGVCGKDCTLLHVDGMNSLLCQCSPSGDDYECQGSVLGLCVGLL